MENKIQEQLLAETQKNLSDLKETATGTLSGLLGMVDKLKGDLSPEQQKTIDEQLSKIDMKKTMEGFNEADKLMSDFLKNK